MTANNNVLGRHLMQTAFQAIVDSRVYDAERELASLSQDELLVFRRKLNFARRLVEKRLDELLLDDQSDGSAA